MSNESTVSPYAGSATSNIGGAVIAAGAACVIGAVVGTVSLARWLSEETPEDRENLEQVRADRRRERLAGSNERPRAITSVELVLRDPETLVRSAERLGYRLESLARPAGTLRSQPHMLLRSASGERMAIEPTKEGRVIVHTAGDRGRIHKVVRQHSGDQVTQFYAAKSMTVQSVRLANGEMQFFGREREAGQRGGAAEVKVQVRSDGTALVDIDKVRGNRCEEIVSEIAEAISGEVCHSAKKDAYFQLPGEPTKTRVKV